MYEQKAVSRRSFLAATSGSFALRAQENQQGEIVLRYLFNEGSHGWLPGFSDYSLEIASLQRIAELRTLPDYPMFRGYYLQSMNRSDDVFMFLKKRIETTDGLQANQLYSVSIATELFSEAQTGCVGIGGAPGESVYFKAGVSLVEPVAILSNNSYINLNVDKGNQAAGGSDAGVVGDIATGIPCEEPQRWVLINRVYHHPTLLRTDYRGTFWVFVGTDSGFEGLTRLYYFQIIVTIRPVAG